jgi:hypothetical protein
VTPAYAHRADTRLATAQPSTARTSSNGARRERRSHADEQRRHAREPRILSRTDPERRPSEIQRLRPLVLTLRAPAHVGVHPELDRRKPTQPVSGVQPTLASRVRDLAQIERSSRDDTALGRQPRRRRGEHAIGRRIGGREARRHERQSNGEREAHELLEAIDRATKCP